MLLLCGYLLVGQGRHGEVAIADAGVRERYPIVWHEGMPKWCVYCPTCMRHVLASWKGDSGRESLGMKTMCNQASHKAAPVSWNVCIVPRGDTSRKSIAMHMTMYFLCSCCLAVRHIRDWLSESNANGNPMILCSCEIEGLRD